MTIPNLIIAYLCIGAVIAFGAHWISTVAYRYTNVPVKSLWRYMRSVGLAWPLFLLFLLIRVAKRITTKRL